MFIDASLKEFTLVHLVTFRIRMKFYFVYINSFMDENFMNELIVKYKVATCYYTEPCHVIA